MHKTKKIVRDATHPANHLFELLKSGKRYRCVKSKTTRFRNSFYLEAIRYMNLRLLRTSISDEMSEILDLLELRRVLDLIISHPNSIL